MVCLMHQKQPRNLDLVQLVSAVHSFMPTVGMITLGGNRGTLLDACLIFRLCNPFARREPIRFDSVLQFQT